MPAVFDWQSKATEKLGIGRLYPGRKAPYNMQYEEEHTNSRLSSQGSKAISAGRFAPFFVFSFPA